MERRASLHHDLILRLGSFLLASLVGLCAVAVAVNMGDPTKKKLVFLAFSPVIPLIILITRQPRAVLLFLWVLALPYNRMYYSFDGIFGNNGSQGPYWIPSDIFLVALLGLWAFELLILKRPAKPTGRSVLPWGIPFIAAAIISALGAERSNWAFFEIGRMLKVGLVLFYLRYNLGRTEWWTCIAAMGTSILVQSSLSVLQMALRRVSGVLSMFGGGGAGEAGDLGMAAMGGWVRAVGTIGHPSNLACFLLLLVPAFIALGLAARPMRLRAVCALTGLAGLVGLACTLSRWPWALTMLQIGLILITLTAMRLLSAQRAIGLSIVAAFAGAMTLLPMSNFIYERITRDLKASLDHRAKDRRVALEIFGESPLIGVGLNNYSAHVLKYDPEMEWALENEDVARTMMNVRVFAALHNFYLFLLAESGIIGLTALLFFFVGVVRTGARAVRATDGNYKLACLGLLLGILGVLAQGFVDFSLWIEPILYSFVLAIALLASAPAIARESAAHAEGVRA